jgi:cell division transport system permease protein
MTIALTLIVLGAYALTLQNLETFSRNWGRSSAITAYLNLNTLPADWRKAQTSLQQLDGIKTATLIKPAEALEQFRSRSEHAANLAEGVSSDILPASIELNLHKSFSPLDEVERIAGVVSEEPNVDEVDFGKEEFAQLNKFILFLKYGGATAGALLTIATLFIISNTIHLTVYSRRDEISILQLVGATGNFVRIPFIIEGALWGFIGGVGAWVGFLAADLFISPWVANWVEGILGKTPVHLYDAGICSYLLLVGLTLGALGSNLAVNRYLSSETPA